ncbi:hypothetical protein, partial [Candidatus Ichthyocystis sparus]
YYLSLRSKLELVARAKFKGGDKLIIDGFRLPIPKKEELKSYEVYLSPPYSRSCPYYARPYYANSGFQICGDMKQVRERMENYLASTTMPKSIYTESKPGSNTS